MSASTAPTAVACEAAAVRPQSLSLAGRLVLNLW